MKKQWKHIPILLMVMAGITGLLFITSTCNPNAGYPLNSSAGSNQQNGSQDQTKATPTSPATKGGSSSPLLMNYKAENNDVEQLITADEQAINPASPEGKKLKEGKEYLFAGNFEKALDIFINLGINYAGSIVGKQATILHGQTLIERGIHTKNNEDLHKAKEKLYELITEYKDVPHLFTKEFTTFLLSLSRISRELKTMDMDIRPHLENLLLYTEDETKDQIYAELGYFEYYRCNFKKALEYFQRADNSLGKHGMILSYLGTRQFDMATHICDEFTKYHKDDDMYNKICEVCAHAYNATPYYDDRIGCSGEHCQRACQECLQTAVYPKNNCPNPPCTNTTSPEPEPAVEHEKEVEKPAPAPRRTQPRRTPTQATSCNHPSHPVPTTQVITPETAIQPWCVVMGSFSNLENARERVGVMNHFGIESVITYNKNTNLYRVRTSGCMSERDAGHLCEMLKNNGFDAFRSSCLESLYVPVQQHSGVPVSAIPVYPNGVRP